MSRIRLPCGDFVCHGLVIGSLAAVIVVMPWSQVRGMIIIEVTESAAQCARQTRGECRGQASRGGSVPPDARVFELSRRLCYLSVRRHASVDPAVTGGNGSAEDPIRKRIDLQRAVRFRAGMAAR